VARLIRQLKPQKVRALFVENISDPRLIERIARRPARRGRHAVPTPVAARHPADTYLKLMAHNARSIAAALAG
jgi:zinc/manganese transport system substrate-binding protein